MDGLTQPGGRQDEPQPAVPQPVPQPASSLRTFVLAGGLGTRLRAVSGDLPKGLMPVHGTPFLRRLVDRLIAQQLTDIVLCLGYGAAAIVEYFNANPLSGVNLHFSIESRPRGTAGALRVAERYWSDQNLILNGDTDVQFAFTRFSDYHRTMCAAVTVGLARVDDAARFGRVLLRDDGRVETFREKDGVHNSGQVNTGLYLANRLALEEIPPDRAYSIERDWLPDLLQRGFALYALPVAESFVDIGTPEDYWRLANREVK